MRILAFETSCDDTAVAVVQAGRQVLASLRVDQNSLHAPLGGVLPELAAREHLHQINPLLQQALNQAGLALQDVDAIAATVGPGLLGSLLVGASTAKALAWYTGKPFIGVHHLQAHVASCYLQEALEKSPIQSLMQSPDWAPPFVCLLVSGGHTQLLQVQDYNQITLLGQTLDDAVGEAYDKVARLMGLPWPGGPALDELAQAGDPQAFLFPIAKTQGAFDFSYSGLKTAFLRQHEQLLTQQTPLPTSVLANLAASFQQAAVKPLVQKTLHAAESLGYTKIAVAGGVSANSGLRLALQQAVNARPGWQLCLPALQFCTDNAAMVGAAAYFSPYVMGTQAMTGDVFSRSGW